MIPDLGKYADTVLSAYGASIVLLVALVWWSLRAARKARIELEKVEDRRNG
ncbi:heme exporter protein CcmD [Shimia abyssi]|uniref:Heme exporter protein D n=1 Tax=Shimia abyssi TaxID=1662395 RepID=A0A2P8FIY5_9RHOB|nr:heme exporter protein CcmD [Shimia abyssi]PSL21668.1 heme exporter protein D [Shimia abyssi]